MIAKVVQKFADKSQENQNSQWLIKNNTGMKCLMKKTNFINVFKLQACLGTNDNCDLNNILWKNNALHNMKYKKHM